MVRESLASRLNDVPVEAVEARSRKQKRVNQHLRKNADAFLASSLL